VIGPPVSGPCPSGSVIIEGLPAAHVTCTAVCSGAISGGLVHPPPPGPPPPIISGSLSVLIHGKPAARWAPSGDIAACGSFLGDPKLVATRTVFIGGASVGAVVTPSVPPSAVEEFANWLANIFRSDDNQAELYGNGIVIQGTPEFRAQTRAALDTLGRLPSGSQLLTDIGNSGQTVTISEETAPNGYCSPHDQSNAKNGTGTDSDVAWNPNHHTTDAADPVTGTPGSTVVLGHELVHASHNANGTNANGPYDSYPGQSGSSSRGEERATVGAGGSSVVQPNGTNAAVPDHSADTPTENAIRDDLGIPRRPSYYPSSWPGGAPW
jgi:uncharacterized Zn-binding protein involved in type VI secretion